MPHLVEPRFHDEELQVLEVDVLGRGVQLGLDDVIVAQDGRDEFEVSVVFSGEVAEAQKLVEEVRIGVGNVFRRRSLVNVSDGLVETLRRRRKTVRKIGRLFDVLLR